MPIFMIQADITRLLVDAIVDPTDPWYSGSGGADYAIHEAAGPDLDEALLSFPPLEVGQAVISPGYELPAAHIIHTVGPIWEDGNHREAELLADCYRHSLELAKQTGCRSIAFPIISGGTFGFPNDDALVIAKETIRQFLENEDMDVYIVTYHQHTFNLGAKLFADVSRFVEENYIEITDSPAAKEPGGFVMHSADEDLPSLDLMLKQRSETFACMLDRLRDERGLSGPDLYKKARVHKSVYSKIMNNINYQPAKITAVAFGLALKLPWDEFTALLGSAAWAMTRTSKFDIVIEFFVKNKRYNIDDINATLYELDPDLPLIGC